MWAAACPGWMLPLQVTGRLVYGEDLYRPGMLYASAKYSEHMHARILKVDTAEAEAMPGVHGVITWKDIPVNRNGSGIYGVFDQPVLAEDRVRYRGDAIAVVAAETREQARAAAEAVKVTYEPLPGGVYGGGGSGARSAPGTPGAVRDERVPSPEDPAGGHLRADV